MGREKSGNRNRGELASGYKHGYSGTRVHKIWKGMRARCKSRRPDDKRNYVDRGITVCREWDEFSVFLADMGEPPSDRHSIERIDNSLGYFKANCKWATPSEQARNRRVPEISDKERQAIQSKRSTTVRYEINGLIKTRADWARDLGWTWSQAQHRLKGCIRVK